MGTLPEHFERNLSSRTVAAWVVAVVLGVMVFVFGMVALVLQRSYHQQQMQAGVVVENLSQVLEEDMESFLDKIDIVLAVVADEITRQRGAGASALSLDSFLARQGARLPQVLGIRVVNAEGQISHAVSNVATERANVADRDYFIALRDAPKAELMVSQPMFGRVSGTWVVVVARRLNNPDGSFAGLVQAAVPVEHFFKVFSAVKLGEGGTVTVFNGTSIVTRYQQGAGIDSNVGLARPSAALRGLIESKVAEGPYHARSGTDGVGRLFHYRRIGNGPLSLVVGITEDDIMAKWWREAATMVWLASLFALLAALSGLGGYRAWKHRAAGLAAMAAKEAEYTAMLQASNAELEQFAYVASHDLREPLRMVGSYVGLLERRLGPSLDDETRQFIAYAADGARRMDRLILDLLDYSRIGRRGQPMAQVDLGPVLAEAVGNLGVAIADAGAVVEVADGLPTVWGSRGELVRLFQNLIGNAVKYRSPERKPVVGVTVRGRDGGGWVLAVSDNGIGIEQQYFERIFGIFQRLHARNEYEGTGIGLAVCRKIVERHGGRIWLESSPGEGSIFLVTLLESETGRITSAPASAAVLPP